MRLAYFEDEPRISLKNVLAIVETIQNRDNPSLVVFCREADHEKVLMIIRAVTPVSRTVYGDCLVSAESCGITECAANTTMLEWSVYSHSSFAIFVTTDERFASRKWADPILNRMIHVKVESTEL